MTVEQRDRAEAERPGNAAHDNNLMARELAAGARLCTRLEGRACGGWGLGQRRGARACNPPPPQKASPPGPPGPFLA